MATRFRADHVGSFLRPPEVKEARQAFEDGSISEEQLREVEDEHILRVIDLQRQAGIGIYTDGELRRSGWAGDFGEAVEGFVVGEPPVPHAVPGRQGRLGRPRHHAGEPDGDAGHGGRAHHRRAFAAGAAAHRPRVVVHQGARAGAVQGDDARRQLRRRRAATSPA